MIYLLRIFAIVTEAVILVFSMEFKSSKGPKRSRFSSPADTSATSWLDKDDEWESLQKATSQENKSKRRLFSKKQSAFDIPEDELEKVQVNINVSLPKFRLFRLLIGLFRRFKQLWVKVRQALKVRRNVYIASGAAIFLVVVVGLLIFKGNNTSGSNAVAGSNTENQTTPVRNELPREKPSFKILYPGGKNEESVGEIVRISPEGRPAAYTYIDTLSDVQINITQQELPDRFKQNSEGELEKLATDNYQKDVIQVDEVKVYHGKSTSGIQSLVFIKGNLLVTVKAFEVISDDLWAAYISAMHS